MINSLKELQLIKNKQKELKLKIKQESEILDIHSINKINNMTRNYINLEKSLEFLIKYIGY